MIKKAGSNDQFTFAISLSVLNHLGRNLYRSFVTVLGEAISNAWDADAEKVEIFIDKGNNKFIIKDNGTGMSRSDFQDKFLKIGYSKRKGGETKSPRKHRPYIGRKGIGKLALLSCAEKITVMSKTAGSDYVGGTIDNTGLDKAITNDLTPDKYQLDKLDIGVFGDHTKGHKQGTLISFNNLKEGIHNSPEYLQKILALYFRFSLLDSSFNMFVNGQKITTACLKDLGIKTQFLWIINECDDPYVKNQLKDVKRKKTITVEGGFSGFIASVETPKDLKVITTDERVSIDLFANGRLREKGILKYIPSARIVEDYLYGQIHYNGMDDETERFSTSREGIVTEDPKFTAFLTSLKDNVLSKIIEDWDIFRNELKKDGDPDNERKTKRDRKSEELYYIVSGEYTPLEGSANAKDINGWLDVLLEDAKFNFGSYAECFISENLIRKYIIRKKIKLSPEAENFIKQKIENEVKNKENSNCNIDIRQEGSKISYLDMTGLANLVDKQKGGTKNCLPTDAKDYRPIRDALMHTALLTEEAKTKLTSVYNNIKGRVNNLLARK